MHIKRASERDRAAIAHIIAESFKQDFDALCKNTDNVARALESGIQPRRFFMLEIGGQPAGVAAMSDVRGRAMQIDPQAYRKHLGLIRGLIAAKVLQDEFTAPLDYPETMGYIEFVGVTQAHRRKGVATALLRHVLENGGYESYVLDVTDVNEVARDCYDKLGFLEFKREPVSHPKQKGFREKVYMRISMR